MDFIGIHFWFSITQVTKILLYRKTKNRGKKWQPLIYHQY